MQGNIKALQNIYKISFLESLSILLFFRFLFLLPNINFLHRINPRKCQKGTVLYFKIYSSLQSIYQTEMLSHI